MPFLSSYVLYRKMIYVGDGRFCTMEDEGPGRGEWMSLGSQREVFFFFHVV